MSKSTLCSLPAAFTVLVTLAWLSTAADNENPVPEDFEVFAQYGPGFSGWKAWNTTITKDGTVVQQVFEDSDWKAKNGPALSQKAAGELWTMVKDARFFDLKSKHDFPVTDHPTLVLKVTTDKKTHEVSDYAPNGVEDRDAVKRFTKVWSEILRKVPSPNLESVPKGNG